MQREPLEAILLVGGQGTRLRPLTLSAPKPLLPTAGVPFLCHQFARAAAAGITHVVLATSYRAEMFRECFGDGARVGNHPIRGRNTARSRSRSPTEDGGGGGIVRLSAGTCYDTAQISRTAGTTTAMTAWGR